ncbi:MAG: bifunctional DNA-formamidopyrimidine glycosylase/DNA-(apurinic or apyrimidinic site) lyase [Myxococcota bacterium]|jgi:formamidopyrimidine-DNA glycosylase|nr:bifunctional DNA-formamidopyrimidine glycosylase/DNA-(apurinic or apyrimidinic site) lyase [Myxococcota bacterium]
MPELPEVETVRSALEKYICGRKFLSIDVRNASLRWPVPVQKMQDLVAGQNIERIERRAKYLLVHMENKHILMLHLGMSGVMRIVDKATPLSAYDHLIFTLEKQQELRFNDVRRFGFVDVVCADVLSEHPRIRHLGLEPLSKEFCGDELFAHSRKLKVAVKNFLMKSKYVVGIGNIYASESLFRSRINPKIAAGRISQERYRNLATHIKTTLSEAIAQGGTTLKDFQGVEGKPGYFRISLNVYDRAGEPCRRCQKNIKRILQSGRSTFYCSSCQKR